MSRKRTILYFSPHQDDELLTMGVDIASSVQAGHNVHVILCTDGSASGVRKRLNNGKGCSLHSGKHTYEVSVKEFISARDTEFLESCRALGVPQEHIHISPRRLPDGKLTAARVEEIMKQSLTEYGEDALVCTISPKNGDAQHKDHKAVGQAAERLLKKGVIRELRLFVEPYHYDDIAEAPRAIPVKPTVKKASGTVQRKVSQAIEAYSRWEPEANRYAVGAHSVKKDFERLQQEMSCIYFTKKQDKDMSRIDRILWRHKKWQKLQAQRMLFYSQPRSEVERPNIGDLQVISVQPGDVAGYEAYCLAHDQACKPKLRKRIEDGSSFWALALSDGTVVSTGWLAYQHRFYISETDWEFDMASSKVGLLYHFATDPAHRGNGYYGILLRCMMHDAVGAEAYMIYTSPDNHASAKGIGKAGFHHDGTFSGSGVKGYLKGLGYRDLRQKYRLFGLKQDK